MNCTAKDPSGNSSSGSFQVVVKPALTLTVPAKVSGSEGTNLKAVVVSGTAYGTANPLTITYNWGDGSSPKVLSVTPTSNGSYSASAVHAYLEEGSYTLTVTVKDSGAISVSKTSAVSIADAPLTASTPTVTITGLSVSLKTTFTGADPNGTVSDYTATITWGDSAKPSAATIGTKGSSFTVSGSHSYAKRGTYTITLTIKDAGGSSITTTLSIKV